MVSIGMPQTFLAFCMNVSLAGSLFSGTLLLMSYRRAVVSHCPISMGEKNVVAQTRTGLEPVCRWLEETDANRQDLVRSSYNLQLFSSRIQTTIL